MATVIIVGIIILSLVLLGWTWVSLGNIEKQKKILYIICGIFITWIITFIIYNISKIGIVYENQEIMKTIRKVFVLVFTIINGYVLLPYTFKIFDKINNEEIKKEQIKKKLIIMLIIFIIISIFEVQYLASLQMGTLQMITKK